MAPPGQRVRLLSHERQHQLSDARHGGHQARLRVALQQAGQHQQQGVSGQDYSLTPSL